MAEYQVVMHHLGRMCETYLSCSDGCPLQKEPNVCFLSAKSLPAEEIKATEQAVMKWAAEHPEPVYPTWWKYMCMIGVIPNTLGDKTLGEVTVDRLMNIEIPADIAEVLGVKPKEGT